MKKYQYEVIRESRGVLKLIGPLEGIRETVLHDTGAKALDGSLIPDHNYYPYCQVLNGQIVCTFSKGEIYDTDEALGVGL